MLIKKSSPYFTDFIKMAELSCKASEYLLDVLKNYDPETLPQQLEMLHEIEHEEDEIKHSLLKRLVKEFVAPIEREDILRLANDLDNVTDKLEDILIRMFMYNIRRIPQEVLDIVNVIIECCKLLKTIMIEFPSLEKSALLKQSIIDINTMEEKGDALYISAMRGLYMRGGSSVEIYAWSKVFDLLEDSCDACEHVADSVELVVMKNS